MNYEIKNALISAKIDSLGAQLNSLKNNNQNLEYMWQANPKYWNRHAPILFPIVGRLKDDEYFYDGKTYKMSQHGFARDCEFELVKQEDDYLRFRLKSSEKSLEIYPFFFELNLSYELVENKLVISYEVKNKTDGKMLFSIGAHPAFNWPLDNEEKNDCFFEFQNIKNTKRYFLNDKGLVYKSADLEIKDNKIPLSEELFKDDALVFNDLNIKQVTFKNSKNKNYVKLQFEKFPYLGLWSKPSGAPFLCIEPWFGVADSYDSSKNLEDKKGIISLKKDEIFSCFYSIEI
ncbi:aldose 1-epimerase family protein [Arcobacter sp. s6]|uniref:aldose 1-epimerase family protein n=1 Tax=Arcobacter sp. s6 TaxID=3230363 RepID=UPI0034A0A458